MVKLNRNTRMVFDYLRMTDPPHEKLPLDQFGENKFTVSQNNLTWL